MPWPPLPRLRSRRALTDGSEIPWRQKSWRCATRDGTDIGKPSNKPLRKNEIHENWTYPDLVERSVLRSSHVTLPYAPGGRTPSCSVQFLCSCPPRSPFLHPGPHVWLA